MSAPRQDRGRQVWWVAAMVATLVLVTAVLFWRGQLASLITEVFLQRQFKIHSQITIRDIDTNGLSIATLHLGDHDELQLKNIRVDYTFDDLRTPTLQRIDVEKAMLHIGYDGQFHLGGLERLLSSIQDNENDEYAPLPIVVLHHVSIVIDTPIGTQHIEGMATYDKDTLFTNLNWTESNGAAQFTTTATIHDVSSKMQPEGQFQASITPQSKLWQLAPTIPPKAGLISLEASLAGGDSNAPGPRLQVGLSAQGIDLAQFAAPIDLHIATTLQAAGQEAMPPKVTPKTIVFRDLSVNLKGGPSATFTGTLSNGNGTLDLRQEKPQLTADIALDLRDQSLTIHRITLKEPTVSLKTHLTYDGNNLIITPTDLGKLTLLDISGSSVTFPSLLTVPIQATSQFTLGDDINNNLQMALSLVLGGIKAQILPAGQKTAIGISATAAKFAVNGNPQRFLQGQLTIPNLQVTRQAFLALLADLQMDMSATLDQNTGTANITIGSMEMPNTAAPLHLISKINLKDNKANIATTIREIKSKSNITLNGGYDLIKRNGWLYVNLPPITFADGGLQPIDLVPALRHWTQQIAGTVALKGNINLASDGALTSDLNLALSHISGKIGPAVFENLNGVIEIDHPWPFSTAPRQSLAVEQMVLGLPFTNGIVQFDVDDGTSIKIDSGSFTLANGQVALDPTTLSTNVPVQQLNLKVSHLSVDQLFKLINIAGLSGDGDIAGNIPVSLFPEGILIKAAKLAATGPGTLKYDVASAPALVKSADDSVKMALGALSDFHYKELVMTLDRQLTGDATLGLHISGSNPSFYNGYPVEFNFTATGRLDEIIRQGLAGYQVPSMIKQRLNQFQ